MFAIEYKAAADLMQGSAKALTETISMLATTADAVLMIDSELMLRIILNQIRDDWIRTSDLLRPMQTRYQAAPRPDLLA